MYHARIALFTAVLCISNALTLAVADAQAPTSGPAAAEAPAVHPLPMTGAEVARGIRVCEQAGVTIADIANWRACSGYLAGILNGTSATASLLGSAQFFCIPEGLGDSALQTGIASYIETSPAASEAPAVTAIIDAVVSLHPCK